MRAFTLMSSLSLHSKVGRFMLLMTAIPFLSYKNSQRLADLSLPLITSSKFATLALGWRFESCYAFHALENRSILQTVCRR